jgi:hypothetical protein
MAQKVTVTISSDLSGETDAHKVDFGLDGVGYEIDLTEAEHQELKGLLGQFVSCARKAGSAAKRGRPAKATPTAESAGTGLTKDERQAVRDFAAAHGVELAKRGRLAELAITAWREKNPQILEHLKEKQTAGV